MRYFLPDDLSLSSASSCCSADMEHTHPDVESFDCSVADGMKLTNALPTSSPSSTGSLDYSCDEDDSCLLHGVAVLDCFEWSSNCFYSDDEEDDTIASVSSLEVAPQTTPPAIVEVLVHHDPSPTPSCPSPPLRRSKRVKTKPVFFADQYEEFYCTSHSPPPLRRSTRLTSMPIRFLEQFELYYSVTDTSLFSSSTTFQTDFPPLRRSSRVRRKPVRFCEEFC